MAKSTTDISKLMDDIAPTLGRLGDSPKANAEDGATDIRDRVKLFLESSEGAALKQKLAETLGTYDINQAEEIAQAMARRPETRGVSASSGSIPLREALTTEIFYPNFRKFIEVVKTMPVVKSMIDFAAEHPTTINFNLHNKIFHGESYILTQWDYWKDRSDGPEYRKRIEAEGDIMRVSGFRDSSSRPVLNPLVFANGDPETKIALKILDEIFDGDWNYGTSLELGENSIYDTRSFDIAFRDRCQHLTERWNTLSDEDRVSWIKGDFTQSKEAREGQYDSVKLAAPNYYTG